jgi:DNA helicase-2/ATP-dependent DNA helicase PcrA
VNLNSEQKSVVEHIIGPLLVLALAGSGKTMLLTQRILGELQIDISPQEMLFLTFTNLATRKKRKDFFSWR